MRRLLWLVVVGLVACPSCSKPPASSEGNVAVTVGEDGFKPSSVTLKRGVPAALVFTRTTDQTCATEVDFPELGIKKELPKNTPVSITMPTDKEQKLTFQCGMGMYKSSVVVTAK
jgi:plastocyanin domain-containing protein